MTLRHLMEIPPNQRDPEWLQQSLQFATELELATIPPYLCALWSIKTDEENYVTSSIKEIVIEEMRHMGLACNMLTTLGGTPQINNPTKVPKYPGPLPGGVRPGLSVALKKFSIPQIETFMAIELPENEPIGLAVEAETFDTIGEFYDAILEAFKRLPTSAFTGKRQLTTGRLWEINDFAAAENAIMRIKRQGEGTAMSPEDGDNLSRVDLAHYYRFREFVRGHKFIKTPDNQWIEDPNPLAMPTEIYPMADIPAGGYAESLPFDRLYTELLNSLQRAWESEASGNDELDGAIGMMFGLQAEAQKLMDTPIDASDLSRGNFGPSFLLVSEA